MRLDPHHSAPQRPPACEERQCAQTFSLEREQVERKKERPLPTEQQVVELLEPSRLSGQMKQIIRHQSQLPQPVRRSSSERRAPAGLRVLRRSTYGDVARLGQPVWPRAVLTARKLQVQRFVAPGEEIVPSKEPVVVDVAMLNTRSAVKLPVAPTNRPVPPVIVAVSTVERTPGAVSVATPVNSAVSVSPLAAVNT